MAWKSGSGRAPPSFSLVLVDLEQQDTIPTLDELSPGSPDTIDDVGVHAAGVRQQQLMYLLCRKMAPLRRKMLAHGSN